VSLSASDLLVAARAELARRGDPRWAPALQRFEQEVGELPKVETSGPPEAQLEAFLRALSPQQRRAVRRLLRDLGQRSDPSKGHGDGSECQRSDCMCASCDPLGERVEEVRRRTAALRLRAGATVH